MSCHTHTAKDGRPCVSKIADYVCPSRSVYHLDRPEVGLPHSEVSAW